MGKPRLKTKVCKTCQIELPREAYVLKKDGAINNPNCRDCLNQLRRSNNSGRPSWGPAAARAYQLKKTYGITLEEWDAMYLAQGGRCAICRTDKCGTGRNFAVDHDHKTGRVRGLLCSNCNRALGMLQDNPEILRRAADYLVE